METLEALVIGAGPAGLQAGLFLGRAKVKTLIIGKPEKSDLAYGKIIGNLFGAPDEPSGISLLENEVAHLKRYDVQVLREEVIDLSKNGDTFNVKTDALKEFSSKSVLIASGVQLPTAGIKGEKEFLGKGVHTCVACDGPLMKGKRVAVIGFGPHAAEEALELLTYTKNVTLYSQGLPWEIGAAIEKLLKHKKIPRSEVRIKAIEGDAFVRRLSLTDKSIIEVDGVFIATGTAGGITFAYKLGLEMDEQNFVKIDRDGKTNFPGVWAAGAVAGGNPQIAKSAGEGCNAAISMIRSLKGLASYTDQT